jgi:hypothetical protein
MKPPDDNPLTVTEPGSMLRALKVIFSGVACVVEFHSFAAVSVDPRDNIVTTF